MTVRMYEQLRSVWQRRDLEQSFVRGYLKTKIKRGYLNGDSEAGSNVVERWFILLGHSLFHCVQKDSAEFTGALLTDLFSPVIARVDQTRFDSFHAQNTEQANSLYLEGVVTGIVDILLCPSSAEEKRTWLEILQQAGLRVPARKPSNMGPLRNDGRKKVVIIDTDVNYSLYESQRDMVISPDSHRAWKNQWKVAARKVLKLPDAVQVRMKHEVLERFVASEERYVGDLRTIVEVYYRPIKIAVASGIVSIPWTKLDTIFLNCESLLTFHKLLLSQMRAAILQPSPNFGQLLLQFIPHMSLYVEFVKSHGQAIKALEDCLLNPSFTDYLENYHPSHDCEAQQLKMLLQQPVGRLEIYQALIEEALKQTSESHCDYTTLGTAMQNVEDLKMSLTSLNGCHEQQEHVLSVLSSVGPRGLILLDPDCSLVLEGDVYLPASSKWTTGTIKQRRVRCYLHTNALVVISKDKKVKNQVLPLCGATVYENVSRTGEVTCAKDSELEVRALKLYSPDGPRNGVVIVFLTQSTKSMWLQKICEMIGRFSVGVRSPSPPTHVAPLTPPLPRTPATPPPSRKLLQVNTGPRRASIAVAVPSPKTPIHSTPELLSSLHPPVETTLPRHTHLPTTLSSSTSNLTTVGTSERGGASRAELPSNASVHDVIARSQSMVSVSAITEGSAPVHRGHHLPAVQDCYSVPRLFSILTSNPPSPRYPATFLLTYRMFTNAHEVLDALIDEHRRGLDTRTKLRMARETFSVPSESLRFFNTLKIWINKYYVDFHHDVTLKQMLVVYLNSIKDHQYLHPKEGALADGILKTVNTRGHIPLIRKSKLKIQVPKAVRAVPSSLLSIPAEQLARQLTWMEHEIYSRIKPYEFLQQKWTKKNRLELAPNICYVISHFNEITLWLAKEVLSPEHPRKRCAVIQHLIEVTKHCLDLGNYVTVFQITSALGSSSIQRLKKTWDYLPHIMLETFHELRSLTTVEGGSRVYRLRQKSSPSPGVPYIGPYLNRLVSIEVGMPTFVKDPPEHVNFLKLTKLASVIEELTRFQNPKYSISPEGSILVYLDEQLESSKEFDEEQRYSRSVEVEPRQDPNARPKKKSLSNLLHGDRD